MYVTVIMVMVMTLSVCNSTDDNVSRWRHLEQEWQDLVQKRFMEEWGDLVQEVHHSLSDPSWPSLYSLITKLDTICGKREAVTFQLESGGEEWRHIQLQWNEQGDLVGEMFCNRGPPTPIVRVSPESEERDGETKLVLHLGGDDGRKIPLCLDSVIMNICSDALPLAEMELQNLMRGDDDQPPPLMEHRDFDYDDNATEEWYKMERKVEAFLIQRQFSSCPLYLLIRALRLMNWKEEAVTFQLESVGEVLRHIHLQWSEQGYLVGGMSCNGGPRDPIVRVILRSSTRDHGTKLVLHFGGDRFNDIVLTFHSSISNIQFCHKESLQENALQAALRQSASNAIVGDVPTEAEDSAEGKRSNDDEEHRGIAPPPRPLTTQWRWFDILQEVQEYAVSGRKVPNGLSAVIAALRNVYGEHEMVTFKVQGATPRVFQLLWDDEGKVVGFTYPEGREDRLTTIVNVTPHHSQLDAPMHLDLQFAGLDPEDLNGSMTIHTPITDVLTMEVSGGGESRGMTRRGDDLLPPLIDLEPLDVLPQLQKLQAQGVGHFNHPHHDENPFLGTVGVMERGNRPRPLADNWNTLIMEVLSPSLWGARNLLHLIAELSSIYATQEAVYFELSFPKHPTRFVRLQWSDRGELIGSISGAEEYSRIVNVSPKSRTRDGEIQLVLSIARDSDPDIRRITLTEDSCIRNIEVVTKSVEERGSGSGPNTNEGMHNHGIPEIHPDHVIAKSQFERHEPRDLGPVDPKVDDIQIPSDSQWLDIVQKAKMHLTFRGEGSDPLQALIVVVDDIYGSQMVVNFKLSCPDAPVIVFYLRWDRLGNLVGVMHFEEEDADARCIAVSIKRVTPYFDPRGDQIRLEALILELEDDGINPIDLQLNAPITDILVTDKVGNC